MSVFTEVTPITFEGTGSWEHISRLNGMLMKKAYTTSESKCSILLHKLAYFL